MRLIPARLKGHPRLGEVVGLLLALVAVLTLAALVSYDPRDASYGFHAGRSAGQVANWIGRGRATLAEALLQLFGAAALLAPLGALGLGWRALRSESPAPVWIGGAAGASLAAITAALVHLLFGTIAYHDQPLPAGGFVGGLVAGA